MEVLVRRFVRILLALGVLAVIAAVIRRLLDDGADAPPPVAPWEPLTQKDTATPPPAVAEPEAPTEAEPWTEPAADGSCPSGSPVKAKLSSKIFHVPGGQSYDRTGADRCYRDAAAAEADGLRQAKR